MGILQRVVRNEAMKNDPPEIYGWRVFALAFSGGYVSSAGKQVKLPSYLTAQLGGICSGSKSYLLWATSCFGGMLFGWDIGSIGGIIVMPDFVRAYNIGHLSKDQRATLLSNIVSTLQGGCFFGSLMAYYSADRWGRKPSLLIAAGVTTLGIIIQVATGGHVSGLYVGRLFAGLGVGAASMLTPLYVSENAPRAIRGGLTGIYQLFIVTGIMLAFWTNYGCLANSTGSKTWQIPLGLQCIPAVCLFVGICLCNESPRWLARQDNWERATAVLSQVSNLPPDHSYIKMELEEMAEQLENERRIIGGASFMDLQREMWTIKGNRNRVLISIGLMVCQQMTGTNAINYYAPLIFENLGLAGAKNGLFATGIYGVVKMITCACFLLLAADSLGRRRSLLWTSIAQGAAMFYIGFYVRFSPPVKGAPIPGAGYFALTCIFLFATFFQFGWGPVCWIIVSEIPTARLRAMNVAIAASTQWLFNFVVAQAVPHMMVTVGNHGYGTYFIFGSFCFAMFVFVWFLIPETKGLSLERMDDIFGVTEIAKLAGDEEAHHETESNTSPYNKSAHQVHEKPLPEVRETTADATKAEQERKTTEKEEFDGIEHAENKM